MRLSVLDRSIGPVKMKTVAQLLISDDIRMQLFKAVGIEDVPVPKLSEKLLHGFLSDVHHIPLFKVSATVYVSNDVSDDVKVFFAVVARRFDMDAREYDPAKAHHGECVFGNAFGTMGEMSLSDTKEA